MMGISLEDMNMAKGKKKMVDGEWFEYSASEVKRFMEMPTEEYSDNIVNVFDNGMMHVGTCAGQTAHATFGEFVFWTDKTRAFYVPIFGRKNDIYALDSNEYDVIYSKLKKSGVLAA